MDTPPPLPPSLPPIQPPKVKKGVPGWAIALIVVAALLLIVGVLAALAIPAFLNVQERARKIKVAQVEAAKPPPPLDDSQQQRAIKFAEQLASDVAAEKLEAMSACVDYEAMTERVFAGGSFPSDARQGFISGMKEKKGGLLAQLAGSTMKMLRFHQRDGFPALTMRVLPTGGGVNYIDLLVKPHGDTFKVVDMFGYLFGSYSSTDARQAMVLMLEQDASLLSKALGIKGGDRQSMDLLLNMFRQMGNGDLRSVQNTYEKLPDAVKKSRPAFVANLQALQSLQNEPVYSEIYAHVLEIAPAVLGKDSATDLLLVDLYSIRKDFTGVQNCIQNVLKAVGEDAYLYNLSGMAAIQAGDFKSAAKSLAAAKKIEPNLVSLVDLELQVRAGNGDFAGVVTELRRFAKATGAKITPAMLGEPIYEAFKKSPEFDEWAKSVQ
ncbi:MAG: hypothetical protein JNM99_10000 [Verrucomicrobiaceae bacterium]|nr:hypothetical protein [Verrucomicrobiaceae bacterium]